MAVFNEVTKRLLDVIDGVGFRQEGAFSLRYNGNVLCRGNSQHVQLKSKKDKPGMDVIIDGQAKGEVIHIPVILEEAGMMDQVYNDFFISAGAEVTIVAGCGIHNSGCAESQHDGIHTFYVASGATVKYEERHYGEGTGRRVLNPVTNIFLEENAVFTMDTSQIEGVDFTQRETNIHLGRNAKLYVQEKLMTHGRQIAISNMEVQMNGAGSSAQIVSRSVAQGNSQQKFHPKAVGNGPCHGHIQCDAMIMEQAEVSSIPEITARHQDASIIHEAAIGRINAEQLTKLCTLGMTEEEAERMIIQCFLQ